MKLRISPYLAVYPGTFTSALCASSSAALPFYAEDGGHSVWVLSLFSAAFTSGMVLSTLAAGWLADRAGRIRTLRGAVALVLAAMMLTVLPDPVGACAITGRFLSGVGVGAFTVLLPLVLAEQAPPEIRGRATAWYQFVNSAGHIIASAAGAFVAWLSLAPEISWRLDLLVGMPTAAVFLMLLAFIAPDRPVRPPPVPDGGDDPGDRRRLLVAVAAMALLSATGIGAVMSYSVMMFTDAGLKIAEASSADTVIRLLGLTAVMAAMPFIDRRGRRFVLVVGCVLAASAMMVLAFSGVKGAAFVVWFAVMRYGFLFGPGVCGWTLAAELLPRRTRARGMSVALLVNNAVTALFVWGFLPAYRFLGCGAVFAVLAVTTVGFALFARFVLPESAGRRLD